jgi:hypothetical protein
VSAFPEDVDSYEIKNSVLLSTNKTLSDADIDECLVSNGCHNNATCKNIPGSYECICGVEVNKGDSCQGKHIKRTLVIQV